MISQEEAIKGMQTLKGYAIQETKETLGGAARTTANVGKAAFIATKMAVKTALNALPLTTVASEALVNKLNQADQKLDEAALRGDKLGEETFNDTTDTMKALYNVGKEKVTSLFGKKEEQSVAVETHKRGFFAGKTAQA